jgi:very-short-patch-repair endonuclease
MSETDRIRQLLTERPGLKAQQIAEELGLPRPEVAAALHRAASDLTQDSGYRWWPKVAAPRASRGAGLLASVCRYYLDCLNRESGSGVSLPASGSEHVALEELPLATPDRPPTDDRAIRKLIRKVRQERGNLDLFLGYGARLRAVPMRHDSEMRIEPVLIYPIAESADCPLECLRPSTGVPLFNLDLLKTMVAVDSGNAIDEATQLAEELGLANDELPPWDEIVLRLQRCRPDWNWREELNPYALSTAPLLGELTAAGIYNRAFLFAGPRSPFTYGLEMELRKLAELDPESAARSALGAWVGGAADETAAAEDAPILEPAPLNAEQRQAVVQGLSAPLTVVTGPPGTGKSQVVVALLANMAWQGRSALFASKNNHAVDVVESRANDLGDYPLLLRLGREEHHSRLAQYLSSALAESAPPEDAAGYERLTRAHRETQARYAAVQREIAATVELRNEVDHRERAAEEGRAIFGSERFSALRGFDAAGTRARLEALGTALEAARDSGILQGRRMKRVAEVGRELAADAAALGVAADGEDWAELHRAMTERLGPAAHVAAYWEAFDRLRRGRPLEDLARELTRITEESAHNSLELWRRWVRARPSRWKPPQRKVLSEYAALLQIVAAGDHADEGAGRKVFRRYYSLFPAVLEALPCWAVTSLSARGRLPFEPGLFDLVIIDEASQCDIASALPLLLRARRAVIIGDPLQLKHVSTVAPQQDRLLLAAHGLAEGNASWAYSVNSLFDLARSVCRHEEIVNLRDHHRSHRDIIDFSNRHFYRGGLRVATDHDALNRPEGSGPAARWIDVRGKVVRPPRGGAMNVLEAEALLRELRRVVLEEGYDGTIGVVTPFRGQANRLRALAQQDAELSTRLAAHRFVVDTVHGFQGDERDVIFFSPVVSLGMGESTLRFLKTHGNLFNVAITRARSELIVVGDRQAALDSEVGYLAAFAEYTHGLGARSAPDRGGEYPTVARPEFVSDWERILYQAMVDAGLRPVPQYVEAPYTLDFALFDRDRRLDIEVDGELYHRNWDGEVCRRDQIRSRRLGDLGWDVMRFWVYELRDDLAGCVARVKAWTDSNPPR